MTPFNAFLFDPSIYVPLRKGKQIIVIYMVLRAFFV